MKALLALLILMTPRLQAGTVTTLTNLLINDTFRAHPACYELSSQSRAADPSGFGDIKNDHETYKFIAPQFENLQNKINEMPDSEEKRTFQDAVQALRGGRSAELRLPELKNAMQKGTEFTKDLQKLFPQLREVLQFYLTTYDTWVSRSARDLIKFCEPSDPELRAYIVLADFRAYEFASLLNRRIGYGSSATGYYFQTVLRAAKDPQYQKRFIEDDLKPKRLFDRSSSRIAAFEIHKNGLLATMKILPRSESEWGELRWAIGDVEKQGSWTQFEEIDQLRSMLQKVDNKDLPQSILFMKLGILEDIEKILKRRPE